MPNIEPDYTSQKTCTTKVVHVCVGVIERLDPITNVKRILIAKRPDHVHQGGFWEFPGGKVEENEPVLNALQRELFEELDITISAESLNSNKTSPIIQIRFPYPEKTVLLDVWRVTDFSGESRGKEGQSIRWVGLEDLENYDFPPANKAIVNACLLPSRYFITPVYPSLLAAEQGLQRAINAGALLIYFRQPQLDLDKYAQWLSVLLKKLPALNNRLMSQYLDMALQYQLAGVHLSYGKACQLKDRPIDRSKWLAVSCHNEDEIKQSMDISADFITLSPLKKTQSHPEQEALGWEEFKRMLGLACMPVYGLGGLTSKDEKELISIGAQGVAGISFWNP